MTAWSVQRVRTVHRRGGFGGYAVEMAITPPATDDASCPLPGCEEPADGHFHELFPWAAWYGQDVATGVADSEDEAWQAVSHFMDELRR